MNDDWDEFLKAVPENEPRVMIYDYTWTKKDGVKASKLVYFMYCPDTCTDSKAKFHIANATNSIKAVCSPINIELQRNEKADLTREKTQEDL